MKGARAFVLAALTALAACAPVGPDYRRPEIELPPDYPEALPAAADGMRADWWTAFNDATLDALVAAARERNADIRVAAAQLEEAEAVLREVDTAFTPTVDLGFSTSESRFSALTALPNPQPRIRIDRRLAAHPRHSRSISGAACGAASKPRARRRWQAAMGATPSRSASPARSHRPISRCAPLIRRSLLRAPPWTRAANLYR